MLKQSLQQKMQQKMSPQQIQLMKMLQIPTVALEQRIKEEMEINPALDEGRDEDEEPIDRLDEENESDDNEEEEFEDEFMLETERDTVDDETETKSEDNDEFDISDYLGDDMDEPDYKYSVNNNSPDQEDKDIPFSIGKTFTENLESQIGMFELSEKEESLALQLIGSLDEAGYLRRELSAIVDDLAFTQNIQTNEEELLKVLSIIQEFDPPGIGARNLRECLLIQLRRKLKLGKTATLITAKYILEDYFEEFTKKHYNKIIDKLEISEQAVKEAIDEILKLNPKPGNSQSDSGKGVEEIVPDFTLSIRDNELEVTLNSRNAPDLKISRRFQEMLEDYAKAKNKASKEQKEALVFVKSKIDSARWFIDAIRQRQQTLMLTITAIMEHQREYFLGGDETKLKPMILKDIAEKVNMDISTISRVANSKYIQTPYGTFLLKSFFSESLSTDSGEEVSTREVKKILQDLIDAENKRKPITDEFLARELNKKGYNIARRTIAKYREQLNIPVARLRREI